MGEKSSEILEGISEEIEVERAGPSREGGAGPHTPRPFRAQVGQRNVTKCHVRGWYSDIGEQLQALTEPTTRTKIAQVNLHHTKDAVIVRTRFKDNTNSRDNLEVDRTIRHLSDNIGHLQLGDDIRSEIGLKNLRPVVRLRQ